MTSMGLTADSIGTVPPRQRASALEVEALDWLALLLSGEATEDDVAAMERWRKRSPDHAVALTTAVRLRRAIAAQPETHVLPFRPSLINRPLTRRAAWGTLAAASIGYVVVDPPLGLWPSFAELTSDYRTGTGGRRQVALDSGVHLDLNTGTSIALASEPNYPGIKLIEGEVAAMVALPPQRAFVAVAGPGRVIAQSARLDLRIAEDGYCANCLTGTVRVSIGSQAVQLQAGHAVVYTVRGISHPYRIDGTIVSAWQRGQLIFRNARLTAIVAEINRYRHGRIIILNSELGRRQFNGMFEISRIDDVVADLQRLSNASATTLVGGVVVLT